MHGTMSLKRFCNLRINYVLFIFNLITLGQGLQNLRTGAKFGNSYYAFSPFILRTLPCEPNAFRKGVRKVINVVATWSLGKTIQKVKWSAVGPTVKIIYGWWGEVKVMLKLVCYNCGVTILETRYSIFFPLCCLYYVRFC